MKFPDVSLETKRVFRFRAGNPAGANGVLMGTLRQRRLRRNGADSRLSGRPFCHFGSHFIVKSDFCRPFSHFGSLFIVKGAHLEAFPSLWQPFYSQK